MSQIKYSVCQNGLFMLEVILYFILVFLDVQMFHCVLQVSLKTPLWSLVMMVSETDPNWWKP